MVGEDRASDVEKKIKKWSRVDLQNEMHIENRVRFRYSPWLSSEFNVDGARRGCSKNKDAKTKTTLLSET